MKGVNQFVKLWAIAAALSLMALLTACSNNSTPEVSSAPPARASQTNITDARRLSEGANKLMDAMNKPKTSFHFSFKGEENINDKHPSDKPQAPKVGPVSLQADISTDEIDLTETRGATNKTSKAKKGDEMGWAMANLSTLGVMTNPNFVIAVGSSVAAPPSTDLVGTAPADKFTFDTTAATEAQKRGLAAAHMILTTIKECKGAAWIAKDSGILIKFNIDADYQDKDNHSWKEHYEGEVTPR